MKVDIPLALPLNRPQYVPTPEALVSALVWGTGRWEISDPEVLALRFRGRGDPKKGTEGTAPEGSAEIQSFAAALRTNGLTTEADDTLLVQALVNGITGVASPKGKAIPASPMTPHTALAQDLRGVLGANNPPDMGGILEAMFVMGSPGAQDGAEQTMGARWIGAANYRANSDPVLRVLDQTVAASIPVAAQDSPRASSRTVEGGNWAGNLSETPFGWLRDSWVKLTSREWVEALPPRVWTDWCTTVLRMAVGFGYLYENRWYDEIGRAILAGTEVSAKSLTTPSALLPWPGARLPVDSRNVKPEIRRLVRSGVMVRTILSNHFERDFLEMTVTEGVEALRSQPSVKDAMREDLSGRDWPGTCKNMYETILYALQQRDAKSGADFYGLLRPHGMRYSVIQPGTEWVAVIASLACDAPGGETNVGNVLRNLARLGLRPELAETVKTLEAAGLAQGSADADHGVRVRSAY